MIGEPQGRLQRASLRARVTWLAAFCVAGAVALVSFGAYMIVRKNVYDALDESLRERAVAVVNGAQFSNEQVQNYPAAFLAAGDVRMGLLTGSTGSLRYPANSDAPPNAPQAREVAQGQREDYLWTDHVSDTRAIAVQYQNGTAIVIAQSLEPQRETLAKLSVVLLLIGGAGVLLAAIAGTAVARTGLRPVQTADRGHRTGREHR